jgi:hypothetical protein
MSLTSDEMKIHTRTVCVTRISEKRLRFFLYAPWLSGAGFVPGALVQALPEPGGFSFTLCNENIKSYSELNLSAQENGGCLIQVTQAKESPQLYISGCYLENAGLVFGDSMLARYEYGLIRLRKLPPAVKMVAFVPGCTRFSARWLADFGFTPGQAVTASAEPGAFTCKLEPDGQNRTPELVRFARENKMYLLQVQKSKNTQTIELPDSCLKKARFTTDGVLLARYTQGFLQLQKPDFVGLGF